MRSESKKTPQYRCMKEINPEFKPGVYFGKAYVYDERQGSCAFVCQNVRACKKEKK